METNEDIFKTAKAVIYEKPTFVTANKKADKNAVITKDDKVVNVEIQKDMTSIPTPSLIEKKTLGQKLVDFFKRLKFW